MSVNEKLSENNITREWVRVPVKTKHLPLVEYWQSVTVSSRIINALKIEPVDKEITSLFSPSMQYTSRDPRPDRQV